VTEDQERVITECFDHLSSCDMPYETILTIDDEGKPTKLRVSVREGSGVSLLRGVGGDKPWGQALTVPWNRTSSLNCEGWLAQCPVVKSKSYFFFTIGG
jgi:hypothetical protein